MDFIKWIKNQRHPPEEAAPLTEQSVPGQREGAQAHVGGSGGRVRTGDFIATYFAYALYLCVVSPLKSLCRLILGTAAVTGAKKLVKTASIVILLVTIPITACNLADGNLAGVSYPIGGLLAWYCLWYTVNNNASADLDKAMLDILKMDYANLHGAPSPARGLQNNSIYDAGRSINDVDLVDDDTYI